MTQGYQSTVDPTAGATEYNALMFTIRQAMSKMETATLVKVVKCTNSGGVSPVGSVDVQPLVNTLNADGTVTKRQPIFNLPYVRFQGGANAIILDPVVGDIGIAIFASRDISSVKATKGQNKPGSYRQFSMADGLYIGGVLNAAPQNYVQFTGTTLNIVAAGTVNVKAPAINLENTGALLYKLVNETFMTLFNAHVHTDPQGGSSSPPITPMTTANLTSVTKAE